MIAKEAGRGFVELNHLKLQVSDHFWSPERRCHMAQLNVYCLVRYQFLALWREAGL